MVKDRSDSWWLDDREVEHHAQGDKEREFLG
jgi:hypothetical protein